MPGRAPLHWYQVSQRNHAGRDVLVVTGAQDHWLAQMERSHRNGLQKSLQALASRRFDPSRRSPSGSYGLFRNPAKRLPIKLLISVA